MQIYAVIPQALAKTSNPTFAGAMFGTGSPDAQVHILGTSEQFRIGYDTTNYAKIYVTSGGNLNIESVGTGGDPDINITAGAGGELTFAGSTFFTTSDVRFQGGSLSLTFQRFYIEGNSGDGLVLAPNNVNGEGNQAVIISKKTLRTSSFDHGLQTNPTLFIQSAEDPDTDNTQWMSFAHDQTNAIFGVGTGTYRFSHTAPIIDLHRTTHDDADNASAGKIVYNREDGAGTETAAFQFEPSHDGAGANDQLAKGVWSVNTGSGLVEVMRIDSNKVVTIPGIGGSGLTGYDLKIGDTSTPDYGLLLAGDSVFGRVPYNAMNMDLDGSVIIRNLSAPATSNIEFAFLESGGTSVRFALGKSAVGNAAYCARSMLIAGPSVWDDEIVTVGYWQTNNSIFDNLACDTDGSGADLGVQNDLEVEGDIFTDSIKESTSAAGVTIADNVIIGDGTAATDFTLTFDGETNDGVVTWMEDEDYFKFSDDVAFANAEFLIMDKASGNGIKVDTTTPTFGFADLLGDVTVKNTGGSRPALIAYRDGLLDFEFAAGEEEYFKYHIPHDYVKGTDIFLHYHWSVNGALVNGGTVTFDYEISYAKAHAQAAFPASVSGTIVSATASSTQYTQELTEVQISASTPSGSQIDTDDLEPDGVIICTAGLNANNLTVSSGGVPDPFIHYVDIHYQTTGLIGTKAKAPDFYA